ncbi:hypothetical protein LCGC14_1544500 [marine sediment metagenome]|uniref:Uncharacterized protein n=1 Tax=marine sediment metagenome TaxID=412755 RepID=A0A0F9LST7_9ZZZZ
MILDYGLYCGLLEKKIDILIEILDNDNKDIDYDDVPDLIDINNRIRILKGSE